MVALVSTDVDYVNPDARFYEGVLVATLARAVDRLANLDTYFLESSLLVVSELVFKGLLSTTPFVRRLHQKQRYLGRGRSQ